MNYDIEIQVADELIKETQAHIDTLVVSSEQTSQ